jgi:hypothetical protein
MSSADNVSLAIIDSTGFCSSSRLRGGGHLSIGMSRPYNALGRDQISRCC